MLKEIVLVILAACAWAETLTPAQYHELVSLDTAPKFSFKGKQLIGKITKVYDGDTYHLVLNVNSEWQRFSVRAAGIDTPERRGDLKEFGDQVGVKTRSMIDDKIVYAIPDDFDKYGRLLATVYACPQTGGQPVNINQLLIAQKMAKPYYGGTKNTFTQADYDAYRQHIQYVALPTFVDCPNSQMA